MRVAISYISLKRRWENQVSLCLPRGGFVKTAPSGPMFRFALCGAAAWMADLNVGELRFPVPVSMV